MTPQPSHPMIHRRSRWRAPLLLALTVVTGGSLIAATNGSASEHAPGAYFRPGNLLVSGSVYEPADIKAGVTVLPPGCVSGCDVANSDGAYPQVWNNDLADASFGITSPTFLDQITPSGRLVSTVQIPDGSRRGSRPGGDHLVTSFSSKSELALNLSANGRDVTFMGYLAQPDALDVSNSNTPGVVDPTNPVTGAYYRLAAQVDQQGRFRFTETNAYSGNNGRAAILNNSDGANALYTAGNAGNGGNPQPSGVIIGTGAQIMTPRDEPERAQQPGTPTPVGSFNVTGNNLATGLPWAPATDGLRNITGRVNRDGTVTIWAVTSTVSGNGDQGADPNKLVAVTDNPATVTPPAESFTTVRAAGFGEVLRGVSFTPGTEINSR